MSLFILRLASWAFSLLILLNFANSVALPRLPGGYGVSLKISGAPSKMGDGAYPRATYLSDGSLLGIYTAFKDGNNTLTIVKSTDNSATWTEVGAVTSVASNSHDLDNGFVLQLPSGRVVAAFRNHEKNPSDGTYSLYRITVCYSDDLGKSWSFLAHAHEETDGCKLSFIDSLQAFLTTSDPAAQGVWEPFLRTAADGSLQVYYSKENSPTDQDVLMKVSGDGGQSWGPMSIVVGGDTNNRRDGMPGVALLTDRPPGGGFSAGAQPGKTLICVYESSLNGIFSVQTVTSQDDGATWGPRQTVYAPANLARNAQSPQIVNTDGVLVVTFMTDEDTGTKDESIKVVTSVDGGRTYGNKLTVADAPQFWPGLLAAPMRSFFCLYGNGPQMVQKISVRGQGI